AGAAMSLSRPKQGAGQDHERPVEEARDNGWRLTAKGGLLQVFRQDRSRLVENMNPIRPRQTLGPASRDSGHSRLYHPAAPIDPQGAVALDEERGSLPGRPDLAPRRDEDQVAFPRVHQGVAAPEP